MSEDQEVDTALIALAMHKLSIDNTEVTDVLTDCNIYLNKLTRSELYKSAELMDLNLIFDCLNTTDPKQIESSCLLLQKLLSVLPPNSALNRYSLSIERALQHPSDTVKSTILSELEKLLTIDNSVEIQVDLACSIIDNLKSNDMSVSYNAVKCLKQFQSVEALSSLPILTRFQSIVMMDAKIRTRVYDVLFHWAKSIEALALISSKGLLTNLVSDITNHDIMMQMVTIQMLIPLSTTEHGFDYLNSVGIISGLYRLLSSCPKELDDPSAVILNPIVLEFFVKIIKIRPHLILLTYTKVFHVIYEVLKEGDDPILIGVAIKGINSLAMSWDCKIVLDTPIPGLINEESDDCLDLWSILIVELDHFATSTKTELKASAIQAITSIIQIEHGELLSINDMVTRTEKWFKNIKTDPIKNIVHAACKLPFSDIQQAGFELLLALVEQPWGQEEINKCPNLLDLIVKSSSSDCTVVVELKKNITNVLLQSDTAKNIFNENILLSLKNKSTVINNKTVDNEVFVDDMAMQ
ncbi:26S proteasome non-ATPase regulatory subunit 5 isoform X2 [Daktulosphaira vitifoliae]|uniref:26S proteasome non-ATPase regulatory subunit 5 isoform X2 n=1 Tax=Daktulosphaira vitifoliae TaxID=58002 RepID=UPI0021A97D99|nr:26S proteasome non-ATPase regulatory subunit 5 isoform X2 [Daktulosphaira vitifoliae]